ncbi:MAG TPA: carbohydrate binding domain-containing protein, partial [Clostridia bacterium]
ITTSPFKMEAGKEYTLTFKAKCTKNFTIPYILLQKMTSPWGNYAAPCTGLAVTNEWQTYTVKFTANATASDARLALFLGNSIPEGAVFNIDTVSLKKTN